MSSYTPLRLDPPEVRLLIVQKGEKDDPLSCFIGPLLLDDLPSYAAISYAWGPSTDTSPITLNEQAIQVQSNVATILRHCRNNHHFVVLWIDALCINQEDIPERNSQVPLMRKIYANAGDVVVWLGEGDAASKLAMQQYIMEGFSAPGGTVPEWRMITKSRNWEALSQFVSRPWWQRTWVIQEVAAAKRILVMCGESVQDWKDLHRNIRFVHEIEMALAMDLKPRMSTRSTGVGVARALCDGVEALQDGNNKLTLLHLLQKFRHHKATDDRDKIFGLLGLVTDCGFNADYSLSTPTVTTYQRLAEYIISSSGNLDILACAWSPSKRPALPSWVPDWALPTPEDYIPFRMRGLGEQDRLYSASMDSECFVEFSGDLKFLTLRGMLYDRISTVGGIAEPVALSLIKSWEALAAACNVGGGNSDQQRRNFLRTIVADSCQGNRATADYIALFQARYEASESAEQFYREVSTKKPPDTKVNGTRIEDSIVFEVDIDEFYRIWARNIKNAVRLWKPNPRNVPWPQERDETFWDDVLAAASHRQFFVTEKGNLGLGPPGLEKGDIVGVFCGGETPLLLRPGDTCYQFLGECYVHGIMDGEAIAAEGGVSNLKETVTLG